MIQDRVSHFVTGMGRSQQVDEVGIVLVQGTTARTTWPTRPVRGTHGRLSRGTVPGMRSPPISAVCLLCTFPRSHFLMNRSRARRGEPRQIRRGGKCDSTVGLPQQPAGQNHPHGILGNAGEGEFVPEGRGVDGRIPGGFRLTQYLQETKHTWHWL